MVAVVVLHRQGHDWPGDVVWPFILIADAVTVTCTITVSVTATISFSVVAFTGSPHLQTNDRILAFVIDSVELTKAHRLRVLLVEASSLSFLRLARMFQF